MTIIVLPNDDIPAPWLRKPEPGRKKQKTVGAGLEVTAERSLVARVAGILHETEHKIWIESAETRYMPKSGDFVLGTVTGQVGDYFRVDVGGPQQAMLSFLNFEGATKRNKPNVKAGSLVYGQILLASKNMEPELTCVDNDQRAQGMGVIQTPGSVVQVPLNVARRLLKPDNPLIAALGQSLKFELVVGMNGHIMITGDPRTVVAVQAAILRSVHTFEANYEKLVASVVDDATTTRIEEI
ncbi:Exosome complex component RRP40 [Aphelenchoides fujianensis]|nr:Exosome complex component RRP40 [Aphelenchoides fujianensis]